MVKVMSKQNLAEVASWMKNDPSSTNSPIRNKPAKRKDTARKFFLPTLLKSINTAITIGAGNSINEDIKRSNKESGLSSSGSVFYVLSVFGIRKTIP